MDDDDEEMQRLLNADMERMRSGKASAPIPESLLSTPQTAVSKALQAMLADGGAPRATFDALVGRGQSKEVAFDLMGRALYCCMDETVRGMPDRWGAVLSAIVAGRTLEELFPNALYERPTDKGN